MLRKEFLFYIKRNEGRIIIPLKGISVRLLKTFSYVRILFIP